MALQIIGYPGSNFVRAVCMVAEEKGVPYENISVMPYSDEVKALNPLGQIPAMRHDGLDLVESTAIARYIDTAFDGPALIPTDPREAGPGNRWIGTVSTTVDQMIMRLYVVEYVVNKDGDGNVVRDVIDKTVRRLPKMYAFLDAAVAPGYLGGDDCTMADCFLAPILASAQRFPEAQENLANSPNLQSYFATMSERDSFKNTAS